MARLLDTLESDTLQQTIRESVNVQLESMSADLRDFVTDTTQRIDDQVNTKIKELTNEGLEREKRATANGPTSNYKKVLL